MSPSAESKLQLTYPQHHGSPTSERGNKTAEPVSNVCNINVVRLAASIRLSSVPSNVNHSHIRARKSLPVGETVARLKLGVQRYNLI